MAASTACLAAGTDAESVSGCFLSHKLVDPAGLGRMGVLVQAKGVGRLKLGGLAESEP